MMKRVLASALAISLVLMNPLNVAAQETVDEVVIFSPEDSSFDDSVLEAESTEQLETADSFDEECALQESEYVDEDVMAFDEAAAFETEGIDLLTSDQIDLTGKMGSGQDNAYTIGKGAYKVKASSSDGKSKHYWVKFKVPSNLCYSVVNVVRNSCDKALSYTIKDDLGNKLNSDTLYSTGDSSKRTSQLISDDYYWIDFETSSTKDWFTFSLSFVGDPEGKDEDTAITLKNGVAVTGNNTGNNTYSYGNDVDYFAFKTGAKGHYEVIANLKTGYSVDVGLYDDLGTELDHKTIYSAGDTISISKTLEANSSYLVKVWASRDTTYSISYKSNEDKEGDSFETAYKLPERKTYETSLCDANDKDYYVLTATHNCNYTFTTVNLDVSAYLNMHIYDASKTELKYIGASKGSTNSVTIYLNKGKQYYVLMDSSGAGKYSLCVKPAVPFTDSADSAWYFDAVAYAYDNNIMSGTSNTVFAPNTKCSRAMMVTILYNVAGKPSGTSIDFYDVPSNSWYYYPVRWAVAKNITSGVSPWFFDPNSNVTREQVAMFLMKYAQSKGWSTTERADVNKFADAGSISGWARDAISWANAKKIINGKGSGRLDPKGSASRAEVAQMIMSFQASYGKK